MAVSLLYASRFVAEEEYISISAICGPCKIRFFLHAVIIALERSDECVCPIDAWKGLAA